MTPSTAGAHAPTESDPRGPSPRVRLGIERNRTTPPEVHPHRAVAVTRSYRETEGQPLALRRGRMLCRILADEPVTIQAGELIVGMKALTPRGSPVYPEINCTWVERDLDRLATRKDTPFNVSAETKRILRAEVFPYWKGRQIADRIDAAVPPEIWKADERGVIYNYFRSRTIGHFQAAYDKVLGRGLDGIIADAEASMARLDPAHPETEAKRQFLESVILACRGGIHFAGRYAAEALRLARAGGRPRPAGRARGGRRGPRPGAGPAGPELPRGAAVLLDHAPDAQLRNLAATPSAPGASTSTSTPTTAAASTRARSPARRPRSCSTCCGSSSTRSRSPRTPGSPRPRAPTPTSRT